MKKIISDDMQQYQYYLTVDTVGRFKHIKVETRFLGAKFPEAMQSKVEMFLNSNEFERLKEAINNG